MWRLFHQEGGKIMDIAALRAKARKEMLKDFSIIKLYKSKKLEQSLNTKVWAACRKWRLPQVPVVVKWLPESDYIAKTDDTLIDINAASEYFTDDDFTRYCELFGAAAHESAHRRYTNFLAFRDQIREMKTGNLFPSYPDESEVGKENLDRTRKLVSKFPNSMYMILHSVENAIEDGRIENLFLTYDSDLKTLSEGLYYLRERTYFEKSPSHQELIEKTEGGMPEFLAISQMLLTYGRFSEIRGFDPRLPLGEIAEDLFPHVDRYKQSARLEERLLELNKILCKMSEIIQEYIGDPDESHGSEGEGSSSDSGSAGSTEGASSGSSSAPGGRCESPSDSSGGESSESGSDGDDPSGTSTNDESETSEKSSGKGPSSEEDKELSDSELKEKLEKDFSGMEGTTPDSSDTVSSAGEEEFGSPSSMGASSKEDEKSLDKEYRSSIEDMIEDEVERTAKDIRSKELSRFTESAKGAAINSGHGIMIQSPATNASYTLQYKKLVKTLEPHIRRAVKLSTFYHEEPEPVIVKHKYFGTRFDASSVARGDLKVFDRKMPIPHQPDVSVGLIVDESGSMGGTRICAARDTAIFLYEYCHRLGIHITIMGHDECFSTQNVRLRFYHDPEIEEIDSCERLMAIASYDNNRDGVALATMRDRLLGEANGHRKLMIIISDGQPCAARYYGESAIKDCQTIVQDCLKRGIVLLAAAIGDDRNEIREIYGEKAFLDITDLSKLPELLTRQIRAMLY